MAGLACAKALVQRVADVTIYEAGAAGRGALWASGGMLAGGFECAEANASQAFTKLAQRGMALWSDWATELGTGNIGYRVGGVVSPASSDDELDWLDTMAENAQALGIACRRDIDLPDGLQARKAICFPEDGELDNRLLGPRLVAFLREAGATIHEHQSVVSLTSENGNVCVVTPSGHHYFDAVVIATGSDACDLAGVEPALKRLHPVKGQMLSLEGAGSVLPFCVRAQNAYISQKQEGRFVIGATSEPGLSDVQVDSTAINALRHRAECWLPALTTMRLGESWAGLRPGTPDGQPMLGAGTLPGVFIALGLYRNGVLLAPAVGEMIADVVMSGINTPLEFASSRFELR